MENEIFMAGVWVAFGTALGVVLSWFFWVPRIRNKYAIQLAVAQERLKEQEKAVGVWQQWVKTTEHQLGDMFKRLSVEALRGNNQMFLDLAGGQVERLQSATRASFLEQKSNLEKLMSPIQESLGRVDTRVSELELARVAAYENLSAQVRSLVESQVQLRSETSNLVKALRAPAARGRWGEIQLRRVVEMAGMVDHCDFIEQPVSTDGDGSIMRPDLIVKLPGGKNVVVDSKVPLLSYMEAVEATDDTQRRALFSDHSSQVRRHLQALSQKAYWEQFQPSPDFVVLFLPGEHFFSAALEYDPNLIEYGAAQRVIIATPTTLISLLRAVAFGWRQESIAESAAEVSRLGQLLYRRLGDVAAHLSGLGRGLQTAVSAYNRAIGSYESRVMTTARQFEALKIGATVKEDVELRPLETSVRPMRDFPEDMPEDSPRELSDPT